jgi:dolichol-phosphate mannosyltransferase
LAETAAHPTLVIIPTYEEAGNIETVIGRILALNVPTLEILVVDDNLLRRPSKMGVGTAYIAGIRYALQNGFEYIFEMDADLSHTPEDLPRLLEKIGGHDLVIGSRYLTGVNVLNWPLSRLLLSVFANWYTRTITRLPLTDCTSGFKCMHRRVFEAVALDNFVSTGYAFQIELHYKIWRHGFRICEVPIIFTERRQGQSKISRKIKFEAAVMVWRLKLADLFGRMK